MDGRFNKVLKLVKTNYQLYLIILLPLIWITIFRYYPMYGVQIAFKKFRAAEGIMGSPWIGFANFTRFFNNVMFWDLIKNTLGISLYSLVLGFPAPIILALALNTSMHKKFAKTVQFIVYMPHFISMVVMAGIIIQFLAPRLGIINLIIEFCGGNKTDFLANPNYFSTVFVLSGIWQNAGWGTIIYLAALSAIDPSLHESAIVDGASKFQTILHIDIPGILPTIVVLLILDCGRIMSVGFEKVYLLQNALNLRASEVISTYVYKVAFASQLTDFSYSAAIGLFNSVINLVLIVIVNTVSKRITENSLW